MKHSILDFYFLFIMHLKLLTKLLSYYCFYLTTRKGKTIQQERPHTYTHKYTYICAHTPHTTHTHTHLMF